MTTGAGISTRKLYSNKEEIIIYVQRPCLLNGIDDPSQRPDLMDRGLGLRLPTLQDKDRQPESDFWEKFDKVRPRIFGALLDALSGAIRHRPQVKLDRLPRMADFALMATATGMGLGWPEGAFLRRLRKDTRGAERCLIGILNTLRTDSPTTRSLPSVGKLMEGTVGLSEVPHGPENSFRTGLAKDNQISRKQDTPAGERAKAAGNPGNLSSLRQSWARTPCANRGRKPQQSTIRNSRNFLFHGIRRGSYGRCFGSLWTIDRK